MGQCERRNNPAARPSRIIGITLWGTNIMKPRALFGIALGVVAILAGSRIAALDGAPTQQTKSKSDQKAGAAPDRELDKDAIRKSSREFNQAFEKGDAKAIAALWCEQGEYYDDSGEVVRGRANIEKAFADHFKEKLPGKLDVDIQSIRFPSRDTAIEEGILRLSPSAGDELPSSTWYSVMHVREDGRWSVVVSREWGAAQQKLDDLAWLIGTWTNKSKDREVQMSFEWNERKTQIRQRFSSKEGGRITASGTQTIALDPQTGQLHSWLFDDDGGHGQALWFRDQNRWVLDSAGVLADGRESLATNILSRLGENEFVLRSAERAIDGSEVPDPDPIKLARVKAAK
jgi:uncharacterized protein (TIGR02246 family)